MATSTGRNPRASPYGQSALSDTVKRVVDGNSAMDDFVYWKPGTQVVQDEMWGKGIGTARPVTVVEDLPGHIALYSHPSAPIASRGIESRYSLRGCVRSSN